MKARAVVVDYERLSRRGITSRLAEHPDIELVAEFSDGESALAALPNLAPDLIFLDIQMPGLSGLEVARALPSAINPFIVFVTAFEKYAVEAFAVEARDYLLKPLSDDRFQQTLTRFRHRHSGTPTPTNTTFLSRFAVRLGSGMQLIEAAQVDRITSYGDYARLHVGTRTFLMRETLQALENSLDPELFLLVHRSCIVQANRIERWFPATNRELVLIL
ncbi:MAG: response regulator transcription factor [Acidobacteriaceae bacterium]|nr:response regulator transcription factor [Acidobacteriaceae bacterium]